MLESDRATLRAAIEAYDAALPGLLQAPLETERDVYRFCAGLRLARMRVREVFYVLTSKVNSRSRAYLAHPLDPWLRRLARMPERERQLRG